MTTIIRHIITLFSFHIVLVLIIGTITFLIFPIESITDLYTIRVLNIPFILFVILLTLLFSVIIGITIPQYWKQQINVVERHLTNILNGRTVTIDEKHEEISTIEKQLKEIEQKFLEQVEYIQDLATKRTEEREKSLQEIVIQERSRLARDLHDSVSQQLFAASMMMSAILEAMPVDDSEQRKNIEQIEKMIHQAQLEMRALLLHLRPVALKNKTLQEGIEDLLFELSNRLPIEMSLQKEDFSIEKGVEDQLFRIVQEALSNALRHASAKYIEVLLIARDERIVLRIVDDGIGFDIKKIGTGSYGLETMQERARDLGGTCQIVSLVNRGTKIEVQVPIVKGGKDVD